MIANTAITGGLGLVYWTVAARLYSQAAVGRASALVSMATLLATIGQLNLGGTLIRFLGSAGQRSRQLVVVIYVAACGSALFLTIFVEAVIAVVDKHGSDVRLSVSGDVIFTLCVLATVIFALQDYALIAIRRVSWLVIENGSFGVAKLILLVALAAGGGWSAVFASWMLPLAGTLPIVAWLLFGRFLLASPERGHRRAPIRPETLRRIRRFALGDAVAGVFAQSWGYALPPIVAASLGDKANARFYSALLITSVLDLVATNYAMPLVTEASHRREQMSQLLRNAMSRIYLILVPLTLCFAVGGKLVLRLFGSSYASAGEALALLAIACLPRALLTLYYAICNVEQRTHHAAAIQGLFFVMVVGGSSLFAHDGGTSVAWVVLIATVFCSLFVAPAVVRAMRSPSV